MRGEVSNLRGQRVYPFANLGINTKFIIILVLSSILPIAVLGAYAYNTSTSFLEQQTESSANQALNRASLYFDLNMQMINDYAKNLSNNYLVKSVLVKDRLGENAEGEADSIRVQIQASMQGIKIPVRTFILSANGSCFNNFPIEKQKIRDAMEKIQREQWYRDSYMNVNSTRFVGVKKSYIENFEGKYHLYFSRSIMSEEGDFLGVVLLDINTYTFNRTLNSSVNSEGDLFYLADENNGIISFSDEGTDEDRKYSKDVSAYFGFDPFSNASNSQYFVSRARLMNEDWTLLYFVDKQNIFDKTKGITVFTLSLIGVLLIIEFVLFLFVNRAITNPIVQLAKAMGRVQSSDLEVKLQAKSTDEIGLLASGFNKMIADIKSMIEKIRLEERQLKDLEFSMLQAQIKPHFLYNSLNGIKWMADIMGNGNISLAISSLIKLLQYSIGNIEDTIVLSKEIEYLESYIFLNNLRFKNKFRFVCRIPEQDMKQRITKFILQPFVENSIIHGFSEKPGLGTITLSMEKSGNDRVLVIEDDGLGMTAESIDRTLNSENGPNEVIAHFGIKNVDSRLKILYGDAYGVKIESEADRGTKVFIRIPGSSWER